MITLDSETCGFHGVMVLLQYAEDDGEIILYNVWKNPIHETLTLLEWIASQEVCMFNAAFDWFHISKIYAMFSMFPDHDAIPEDHIEELAILEEKARLSPFCIKPKACIDLMLHARKGPYQSLMKRNDVRIRRVPTRLAEPLQKELEKRIEFDGIYFARRKDKHAPRWNIRDVHFPDGDINPDFKDIVLKFHASGALKTLAEHALGRKPDTILKMADVAISKKMLPKEFGYAPFALAVGRPGRWNWAWPEVLHAHISHWAFHSIARKYASDDVKHTRDLYHHFDRPRAGDTDSELACMVGAVRWRGFAIDIDKLKKQRNKCIAARTDVPTSPNGVKGYLGMVMSPLESKVLNDGTGKVILEAIAEWKSEDLEPGEPWVNPLRYMPHRAAIRAQEVLDAREADKEIQDLDKLILAGRFHASFKVIGTKSTRMSGDDDLNSQGIKGTDEVRECFPLADPGFILVGGDFVSFEVTISEAVYKDPKLREDLLAGKKIHALFAQELFDMSYDQVMTTKGTSDDKYVDGKRGIFAMNYGGTAYTLQTRIGISEEVAEKAFKDFGERYPGIARARKRIKKMFCSMQQPAGLGTQVVWKEPSDYIESLLGFKRYFTLENKICKALFDMAQNPPGSWKNVRIKVKRRERVQTASGAVQTALYAAAFAIQGSNLRAAANHEIQSTGAEITKEVQRALWDLQPCGVHQWLVLPLNIHDEVLTPCKPELVDKISEAVSKTVESFRPIVPLIKMDWKEGLTSWAGK
ncbi:MAG: DNA polymerase [Nitrosomonadaceae bacterium]